MDIPTVAKFATVQKEGDDAKEILKVLGDYSKVLDLLDDYDHRTLKKIEGNIAESNPKEKGENMQYEFTEYYNKNYGINDLSKKIII